MTDTLATTGTLTVQRAGLATVQDLGRFGHSRYGLPGNGALDPHSARLPNGPSRHAAAPPRVDITAVDFGCPPSTDILVAVTGAPADVTVGGVARPMWEPLPVRAGETISVTGIRLGLRV